MQGYRNEVLTGLEKFIYIREVDTDPVSRAGQFLKLNPLDPASGFERVDLEQDFKVNEGAGYRAVAYKYNPADHYKRIRKANEFSFTQKYQAFDVSIKKYEGKTVDLLVPFNLNGDIDPITLDPIFVECWYFPNSMITESPIDVPDEDDASISASGLYSEHKFIIVGETFTGINLDLVDPADGTTPKAEMSLSGNETIEVKVTGQSLNEIIQTLPASVKLLFEFDATKLAVNEVTKVVSAGTGAISGESYDLTVALYDPRMGKLSKTIKIDVVA